MTQSTLRPERVDIQKELEDLAQWASDRELYAVEAKLRDLLKRLAEEV